MTKRTTRRVLIGTAAAAAGLAAGLSALFAFTPKPKWPEPVPGRPLLESHGDIYTDHQDLFTDRQVGLQFTAPANWSMQARSTESPHEHKPDRMVVKYKRLIPGLDLAWFKVNVSDVPEDQSPADLLKKRKPPEEGWVVRHDVEDGLTVAGRPAARVTFGGPLDPDTKGARDFTCEVVAVRRGPQVFYFSGTYTTADPKGQKRVRTAVDSVVLDPQRFAPAS
jgi:hypothetical protein